MDWSSDSDSQYSTVNSLSGLFPVVSGHIPSVPVDVPERLYRIPTSVTAAPSGCRGGPAWLGSESPCPSRSASAAALCPSPPTAGSPISRSLRLRTAQAFSLDSARSRNSNSMSDAGSLDPKNRPPAMLGLAILLPAPPPQAATGANNPSALWRRFLLTHMALLQADIARLQHAIQSAYAFKVDFYGRVHAAWEEFRRRLGALQSGVRLREPVWASLRRYSDAGGPEAAFLAARFTAAFRRLAHAYDNKAHSFFVSNLITGVLMEHQTWLGSVCPPTSPRPFLSRLAAATRFAHGSPEADSPPIAIATNPGAPPSPASEDSTTSHLAYNPLLAQFSELRGRIGGPGGEARVLVTGSDASLVTEFLFLLSYFIRSSEVRLRSMADPTTGEEGPEIPAPKSLSDDLFNSLPIPPSHPPPGSVPPPGEAATHHCCDFVGAVDAVTISGTSKDIQPGTPPSLGSLFSSSFVDKARKRLRARSPVPEEPAMEEATTSREEEALVVATAPPVPVLQSNNSRFQVTTVPESPASVPRSSSFRRPGSPRKRHSERRGSQTTPPHPHSSPQTRSDSVPMGKDRIPLITVPLEDSTTATKLRKVSDSFLHQSSAATLLPPTSAAAQTSPRSPDSAAASGGDSSDGECGGVRNRRTMMPTSLDSGIAEPEVSGGRCARRLSWEEVASVRLHESVFGEEAEVEELVPGVSPGTEPVLPADHPTAELSGSLIAGFLPRFSPHFALSGCPSTPDLIPAVQEEVGRRSGENGEESVCVVGDTESWEVRLVTKGNVRQYTVPSQIVLRMVDGILTLGDITPDPQYLLGLMEESLREVWAKSVALAGAVAASSPQGSTWVEMNEVVRVAGVDFADLPLLFSVANLHSQALLQSLSL